MSLEQMPSYFDSLEEVRDRLREGRLGKTRLMQCIDWADRLVFGLALITFIPVLPILLSVVLPRFGVGFKTFKVWGLAIEPIFVYWLACVLVVVLLIFLAAGFLSPYREKLEMKTGYKLSAEQICFLSAYGTLRELGLYTNNRLEEHLQKAKNRFSPLAHASPGHMHVLTPSARQGGWRVPFAFISQDPVSKWCTLAFVARDLRKYPSFSLSGGTQEIAEAFDSLHEKVFNRIEDARDIPAVIRVVRALSEFLYAYLPEHEQVSEKEELGRLRDDGERALQRFVVEIRALSTYAPSEKGVEGGGVWQRLEALLENESKLVRFGGWTVVILGVTILLSLFGYFFFRVSLGAIVVMVVSTTVLGAATLTALAPLRMGRRETKGASTKE